MADVSRNFRERAQMEAARYGPDPWVFVRELLQNARDAGATRVELAVDEGDTSATFVCRDDGDGMTYDHARRYLFSLYASSKEGRTDQAGRFGVGFWSVLRFEPNAIIVKSRPRVGTPWGVELDGSLARARLVAPPDRPGTEVVLVRRAGDGALCRRIRDAAWQNARYLTTKSDRDRPLEIRLNGEIINEPFRLLPPSTAFRRGRVRGVVALGPSPRVELFSRGLRVRAAACVEDLLGPGRHSEHSRVYFPEMAGGLAPQALLESDEIDLVLSRSDARDDRTLRRIVRLARRELEHLIERQLTHARPTTWWRKGFERMTEALRHSTGWQTAAGGLFGGLLAIVGALWLWGDKSTGTPAPAAAPETAPALASKDEPRRPYVDLGDRYHGPRVDVVGRLPAAFDLRYRPAHRELHFAALRLLGTAEDGSPMPYGVAVAGLYPGPACGEPCIDIELRIDGTVGSIRLPVPTGMLVVAQSVELAGHKLVVHRSTDGLPVVVLDGEVGTLRYRVTPGNDTYSPPANPVVESGTILDKARKLRRLPVARRIDALEPLTRELIRYDRSPAIADRHHQARARGQSFLDRTMAIGAGDCDVQNGLLAALMRAAGVESWLVVGMLGRHGTVAPWLHAWVEYKDDAGDLRIADASVSAIDATAIDADGATGIARSRPSATDGPIPAPLGTRPDAITPPPLPPPTASPLPPHVIETEAETVAQSPGFKRDHAGGSTSALLWLVLPLLGVPLLFLRSRIDRQTQLDESRDLSSLLRGALQQPIAFRHMPAIFHRPLIPVFGGGAISLEQARRLAGLSRLFRTRSAAPMAQRAADHGAVVLADKTPEARTIADALGAIDLDVWHDLLERSAATNLLEDVDGVLRDFGESWSIRIAPTASMMALDLAPLGIGLRGSNASRLILLPSNDPTFVAAQRLHPHRRAAAIFAIVDHVAAMSGMTASRKIALSAALAQAALIEVWDDTARDSPARGAAT